MITSNVIHSTSSSKQEEANSDFKKEKDSYLNSLMTSKEIDYSNSDVVNINSNTKFVDTKLVKSETFVDVSEIKSEKLDPLEVPKTVNKPSLAK